MEKPPSVIIVELGSQYTLVIGRTLRELGFRSVILSPRQADQWIQNHKPKAIILSGGQHSVNDEGAPTISRELLCLAGDVPMLCICYGMQLIAKMHGGKVASEQASREYGQAHMTIDPTFHLFRDIPQMIEVLASHGDTVITLPPDFSRIAHTTGNGQSIAGMVRSDGKVWCLQFHPEVNNTPQGKTMLLNFMTLIAQCERDWEPRNMVQEIQQTILTETGGQTTVIGFSGGVDSTTLTAMASPVLGANLKAVCIDGGQLREGELETIKGNANAANVSLEIVSAHDAFQDAFNAVAHRDYTPELKRLVFREVYAKLLTETIRRVGAVNLLQGTLAPDRIESGLTGGAVIKTHHNTGFSISDCKMIHPLSHLFKYEVAELGQVIELPDSITYRQPFPGPGLFVRVVGGWPTPERLEVLRSADHEVTRILTEQDLMKDISQLVVGLFCNKVVGVKGDARSLGYPIAIKGVKTVDFMTAKGYQLPAEVRRVLSSSLTKHPHITTVGFFEVDKPPGTVEFE